MSIFPIEAGISALTPVSVYIADLRYQSFAMAGHAHEPPFDSGLLTVTGGHQIHYSQHGSPRGLPALFIHGGPGGRARPRDARFFDPVMYRVVMFDQRGSGQSLPAGSLDQNTTHDILADIEALRIYLRVPKWHVILGGSWGSTLSLLYAQAFPSNVGSLVLRGVFTARYSEFTYGYSESGAAAYLFPDHYERFLGLLSQEERKTPFDAYHRRLTSNDVEIANTAAREWNRWSIRISSLQPAPSAYEDLDNEDPDLMHALLESHYFQNRAWLREGQILEDENMAKISHIPGKHGFRCVKLS